MFVKSTLSFVVYSNLFKPGSSRPAARGKEQSATGVKKPDRAIRSETIGVGELNRAGNFNPAVGNAIGVGVTHRLERVGLIARRALPDAPFRSLSGIATRRDTVAGVSATLVEDHDGLKCGQDLAALTVDSVSGNAPRSVERWLAW